MSACRACCSPTFRSATRRAARAIRESQAFTLDLALKLLEAAPAPRTTVQSPLSWSDSPDWKLDYCNIERVPVAEIAQRRAEFERQKNLAKAVRAEGRAGSSEASTGL